MFRTESVVINKTCSSLNSCWGLKEVCREEGNFVSSTTHILVHWAVRPTWMSSDRVLEPQMVIRTHLPQQVIVEYLRPVSHLDQVLGNLIQVCFHVRKRDPSPQHTRFNDTMKVWGFCVSMWEINEQTKRDVPERTTNTWTEQFRIEKDNKLLF